MAISKYLITTILFLNLGLAYSQDIEMKIKNLGQNKANLASLSGEKVAPTDTKKSNGDGILR